MCQRLGPQWIRREESSLSAWLIFLLEHTWRAGSNGENPHENQRFRSIFPLTNRMFGVPSIFDP